MLGGDGDVQSYNLFAYCGNNPVSKVDAIGKFANSVIGLVVGGVVGGLSALMNGDDFTVGAIKGATTGFFSGMAVDAALAVVASGPVGIIAAGAIAFGGGFAGNIIGEETESLICTGQYRKISGDMMIRSAINGALNVASLGYSVCLKDTSAFPTPKNFNEYIGEALDMVYDSSFAFEDVLSSVATTEFTVLGAQRCSLVQ